MKGSATKPLGLLVATTLFFAADAFVTNSVSQIAHPCSSFTALKSTADNNDGSSISRRSAMFHAITTGLAGMLLSSQAARAEFDDGMRGGVQVTPFNGLIYNYRGGEFGGLDASTLNEPSVPYKDFLARLDKGEVEFVEFVAPDGDAAYVTFKSDGKSNEKPIRIGEGYPIEQHDGWSSPAFVVKSVKKNGVPYKFTVPGLEAYK